MRQSRLAASLLIALIAIPAAAQWSGTNPVFVPNTHEVGIGTNDPQSMLHIAGPSGVSAMTLDTPGVQRFRFQTIPGIPNWGAFTLNANYTGSSWLLDDSAQNAWFFKLDGRSVNAASPFNGMWLYRIPSGAGGHTNEYPVFGVTNGYTYFRDRVGIGTNSTSLPDSPLHVVGNAHVTGNLTVDGNLAAKYQDIAEWVPSTETLAPGTVVVLDPELENHVLPSSRSYDTSVAGVVSAQPGIILGEASADSAKIATTGRVLVHVDARKYPIRIGDLLVSSDVPGTAMRSMPIEVSGQKMHRPGTVIGKALQPLASGEGDILVLLSLQ